MNSKKNYYFNPEFESDLECYLDETSHDTDTKKSVMELIDSINDITGLEWRSALGWHGFTVIHYDVRFDVIVPSLEAHIDIVIHSNDNTYSWFIDNSNYSEEGKEYKSIKDFIDDILQALNKIRDIKITKLNSFIGYENERT